MRRGARSGLACIVAVHSTRRGPSLGGCRLWSYAAVADAAVDALRLSRAMTFKSAAAGLPLGGGKGVIMVHAGEPLSPRRRRDALLDFADTVQSLRGRYITAEDVGTSSRDMSVIAQRTRHVAGLARGRGGSGDPSRRTIAERLGATWMDPARALVARVDVLSPCALGGVLDARSVGRLRCGAIAGAANNQLAGEAVAEALRARGILWAPDFIANAGGVINIAAELDGYDRRAARAQVRRIGDTLREVFERAEDADTTPLAAAMDLARARLAVTARPAPSVNPEAQGL